MTTMKSAEVLEQLVSCINVEQDDAEEHADGDMAHANAEGAVRVLRDRTQLRQQVRYDNYAMLAYDEPAMYVEVMMSCDRDKWQAATNDEMMSLLQNGTWNLVERPDRRAIIKNR